MGAPQDGRLACWCTRGGEVACIPGGGMATMVPGRVHQGSLPPPTMGEQAPLCATGPSLLRGTGLSLFHCWSLRKVLSVAGLSRVMGGVSLLGS